MKPLSALGRFLRRVGCCVGLHSTVLLRDRYDRLVVRACWICNRDLERKLLTTSG